MTGKSHIAMNAAVAAVAVDTYILLGNPAGPQAAQAIAESSAAFLTDGGSMPTPLFMPLSIFLYMLGAVLPDVDHPYSMLGKVFHIPVAHRTWLHAIYIPIILLVTGIWVRPLFWLGLGYFFHLFFDSFSRSGLNWFYPHRTRVKLKLYHTNQASEYIFGTLVWIAAIAYTVLMLQLRFGIFTRSVTL